MAKKVEQIKEYLKERAKWIKGGKRYRTTEEMKEIYQICSKSNCGHFEISSCGLCGCFLHPSRRTLNKIAWATTECPHENKYWTQSEDVQEIKDEDLTAQDYEAARIDESNEVSNSEMRNTVQAAGSKSKRPCGCKDKKKK